MNKYGLRILIFFAVQCTLAANSLKAQDPMYKVQNGTAGNITPFGTNFTRKTQIWYNPSDLQPAPASGTLSAIWFRNTVANATASYASIKISLKQPATGTGFTGTNFETDMATVLDRVNYTLTGNATADGWFSINLDSAFSYDNTRPLVCEIIISGLTGGITTRVSNIGTGAAKKLTSTQPAATTGTNANTAWNDFGFDILPPCTAPPAGGTAVLNNASYYCGDSVFTVSLTGHTLATGQTYEWQFAASASGPWTDTGGVRFVPAMLVNAQQSTWFRCRVSCSAQSAYSTPVLLNITAKLPAGNYSIDNTLPTSGSNFHSFTEAVTAMRCGITGPVVFTVTGGQVFDEVVPPLPAIGSAASPIVFQKGPGANPVISRSDTGISFNRFFPSNGDAVLTIDGTDYITFDGIDVTASSPAIEYGYLIRRAGPQNGAKHVTIKNATVTMNRGTKNTVVGVFCSNYGPHHPPDFAGYTVTGYDGRHENITITGNTISNVNNGIVFQGAGVSSLPYIDSVIVIGTMQSGNTISDFNTTNSTTAVDGIQLRNVTDVSIVNNTITNSQTAVSQNGNLTGIFLGDYNLSARISNNRVTLNSDRGMTIHGIYSAAPLAVTTIDSNTIAINNNHSHHTRFIASKGTPASISYNLFANSTFASVFTDGHLILNEGGGTNMIRNNYTDTIVHLGAGSIYGYTGGIGSGGTDYVLHNRFTNIKSSSRFTGVSFGYNPRSKVVRHNTITNIETAGEFGGIILPVSAGRKLVTHNRICNIKLTSAASFSYNYGIRSQIGTNPLPDSFYNNIIAGIELPAAANNFSTLSGLELIASDQDNTSPVVVCNNTVYLNTPTGGSVSGMSIGVASNGTGTTAEVRNNIVVNNSITTGGGTEYVTALLYGMAPIGTVPRINSNNNLLYVARRDNYHMIFAHNNDRRDTTMESMRSFAGNDLNSVFEMPQFSSLNPADSNYLHIDPAIPSQAEGAAVPIAGITDDIRGNTRHSLKPDIGAVEFNGTAANLTGPGYYHLASPSICTSGDTLRVYISDSHGVDTTIGSRPRIWFRKTSEMNQLASSNDAAANGWKWAEAINASSPFTFFVNPALLSSAVSAGDTIVYFFTAQDAFGSPVASVGGATLQMPASVALTAAHFPAGDLNYRYAIRTPTSYTISADRGATCAGANPVRFYHNSDNLGGTSLQWQQSSPGSGTWSNIPGANSDTVDISSLSTSTQFRLIASCNNLPISTSPSNVIGITVYNAQLISTSPASRCGTGSLQLTAAAPSGATVNWYSSATAASPVDTGNIFATPVLDSTTTYYAAAIEKTYSASGGRLVPSGSLTSSNAGYGMAFTLTRPVVLNSVDVFSSGGTQFSVELYDSTGATLLKSASFPALAWGVKSTLHLGWHLYPGTYRIKSGAMNGSFKRETNITYPVALNEFGTIDGQIFGATGTVSTSGYYWFYNWSMSAICVGNRVPVTATIDLNNTWTGNQSNAWENPANWSCGVVPGADTRVVIPAGANVIISSNVTIYSLTVNTGATVTVSPGYTLTVLN